MKQINWGTVLFAVALMAVIYGLLKVFNGEQHMDEINIAVGVASALLYILSIAFWNVAWGRFIRLDTPASIQAGFAAQLGGLTPFSLGADFLRGGLAKGNGRKFVDGFAASFASKFHKIWIALAFSSLGVGALLLNHSQLEGSILFGIGIPILMLVGLYFLTRNYASILISTISMRKIRREDIRDFSKKLRWFIDSPDKSILALLFLSLAFEFLSFYLAFYALSIPLDLVTAYLVFILLFFASKALFVPQGIGITELVGIFVLGGSAGISLVAAGLLLWNVVRIWIPTIVAGIFAFSEGKKLAEL